MEPALLKVGDIKPVIAGYVKVSLTILSGGDFTVDEAIHDIRLNMKKARAALKLAAGYISRHDYDINMQAFRKTGRILSQWRDSSVYRKTLREFVRDYPEIFPNLEENPRISFLLEKNIQPELQNDAMNLALSQANEILRKAYFRLRFLKVSEPDRSLTLNEIEVSYSLVQSVYLTCRNTRDLEDIHQFRKKAKDLLYQLWFVRFINPMKVRSLTRRLDRLTSNLGKFNDLTQLAIYLDINHKRNREIPEMSELLIRIREKQDRYMSRIWPSAYRNFRPGLRLADLVGTWVVKEKS